MQTPNDSATFLLWLIAGVSTLIFGILWIALEKNLGYFVRKIFEPAARVGGRPARKSAYLWIAWIIFGFISIISTAVASSRLIDKPVEVATDHNQPTSTLVSPEQEQKNLAPNPSFEQGRLQPVGWTWSNTNAEYLWNPEIAHSGERSICIRRVKENISAEWNTGDWIEVDSGKSYRFSVLTIGDMDREVYLGIYPLNAEGEWLTGYAERLSIDPYNWTKTEGEYAIPYKGSFVVLALEVNNPAPFSDNYVCFDDIVFEPIDSSE